MIPLYFTPAGMKPSGRSIFAADLHLDGSERARERFRRLLRVALERDAAVFLLGDVFHYWLGPRHLALPMFRRELEILRGAVGLGTPITIVPGNRDFLLDAAFGEETGVHVAPDAIEIQLAGERIHLSHGDLFGSSDVKYLRMRRVLHSKPVRFAARTLPTFLVAAVARRLRRHSEEVVAQKSAETLAPDVDRVKELVAQGYSQVICGHFHHVRDEPLTEGGRSGRFRVLEPFEDHGYFLQGDASGWAEERLEESMCIQ